MKDAATIANTYDTTGAIIQFESGDLSQEGIIELFQNLINSGLAWRLQGSYGRMADKLIEAGYCTNLPTTKKIK